MDLTTSFRTLDQLLHCRTGGLTLCEAVAKAEYPKVRRVYGGDREDLAQTLVVGLLVWARTQPDQGKLSEAGAVKAIKRALAAELKGNRKTESEGVGAEVGEDGELLMWNPLDPGDPLTPERAKALGTASFALAKLVGEDGYAVLKGRLVHDLPFTEIKRRFSCDRACDPDLEDTHNATSLGYPPRAKGYTVAELEALYDHSLALIRERYDRGDWKAVVKALLYTPPEFERFEE